MPSIEESVIDIFNKSQIVADTREAQELIKRLYDKGEYEKFLSAFKQCVLRLLHSPYTDHFKRSCQFVGEFIGHLSQLANKRQGNSTPCANVTSKENEQKQQKKTKQQRPTRGNKRKNRQVDELVADYESQDELVSGLITPIQPRTRRQTIVFDYEATDHDKFVSAFIINIVVPSMLSANEECRLNTVILTNEILKHVVALDEELDQMLANALAKRIRDKKPAVRAHAVYAAKKFERNYLIKEAFLYHFERDPEHAVRKALLQVMSTDIHGFQFLVNSTRDSYEPLRKTAYRRLGKISPYHLTIDERHQVLHNGFSEKNRHDVIYREFRISTLEPWIKCFFDGQDLTKSLNSFDVINYCDNTRQVIKYVLNQQLETIPENSATTKLHKLVESFRSEWLCEKTRIPKDAMFNENVIVLWLTMIDFCKSNQVSIKPVKLKRTEDEVNLEDIHSQSQASDDEVDLYDRLMPDLVDVCAYIRDIIATYSKNLNSNNEDKDSCKKMEFIYNQIMQFSLTYEVGDEAERREAQSVFSALLKESKLVKHFEDFYTPIIKALSSLVYTNSQTLLVNLISEMINDVRSHIEDLNVCQSQRSTIQPSQSFACPKSSTVTNVDKDELENEMATLRLDREEVKDKLDEALKSQDYLLANVLKKELEEITRKLQLATDRRFSVVNVRHSDVPHFELKPIQFQPQEGQIFKEHLDELIKCLQMFSGCLKCCHIQELPNTMQSHLETLSIEGFEWPENTKVRSLVIECNGLAALVGKDYAFQEGTIQLFCTALKDPNLEVKTIALKCAVDVVCEYEEMHSQPIVPAIKSILMRELKNYGIDDPATINPLRLEFLQTVVETTAKVLYFNKLSEAPLLAHLIVWWYHPRTHSKPKQFIGIFLPLLVHDAPKKEAWLKDLLVETFILSIEYFHDYGLGPGQNFITAADLNSLIRFLTNLVPLSFHDDVIASLQAKVEELEAYDKEYADLCSYLNGAIKMLIKCKPISATNKQRLIDRQDEVVE